VRYSFDKEKRNTKKKKGVDLYHVGAADLPKRERKRRKKGTRGADDRVSNVQPSSTEEDEKGGGPARGNKGERKMVRASHGS